MKKLTIKVGQFLSILAVGAMLSSCFGKFALTRKLYEWNDSLGNKFLKTIIFWGLNIIPVYSISAGIDFIILNLIEFWTGSNPLAMAPGQKETKVVWYAGNMYELTAEHCRFTMKPLTTLGQEQTLIFDTTTKSILLQAEGQDAVAIGHYNTLGTEVAQPEIWAKATK